MVFTGKSATIHDYLLGQLTYFHLLLILAFSCIFVSINMRLWQNAKKETEAADRLVISANWEKTFWKRTAAKGGVIERESGLQYLLLEEGKGPCPDLK